MEQFDRSVRFNQREQQQYLYREHIPISIFAAWRRMTFLKARIDVLKCHTGTKIQTVLRTPSNCEGSNNNNKN